MKKILCIISLLILGGITGCGNNQNDFICTNTIDEELMNIKSTITGKIKDKYVENVVMTLTFDNQETVNTYCETISSNKNYKCEGKKITISNYEKEYLSKKDKVTKNELISALERDGYTCK